MPLQRCVRRQNGFTLIEALLVALFIAVLLALGMPALQQMIYRSRLEGAARETAVTCQLARLEAIKGSIPTGVRFDPDGLRVVSWVDTDANGVVDDGERELTNRQLPGQVTFAGPGGTAAMEGFQSDEDGVWITFNTDGSIVLASAQTCEVEDFSGYGCVRFADQRSNFIELSIGPIATANVALRKWDGSAWKLQGEDGMPWDWN